MIFKCYFEDRIFAWNMTVMVGVGVMFVVALFMAVSMPVMFSGLVMIGSPAMMAFVIVVIETVLAPIPGKVIFPVVAVLMFSVVPPVVFPGFEMLLWFMVAVRFSLAFVMPLTPVMGDRYAGA